MASDQNKETEEKSWGVEGDVFRHFSLCCYYNGQAVMKVPTEEGRAAWIRKAFKSDWEGAAPVRAAPGTVRFAAISANAHHLCLLSFLFLSRH